MEKKEEEKEEDKKQKKRRGGCEKRNTVIPRLTSDPTNEFFG